MDQETVKSAVMLGIGLISGCLLTLAIQQLAEAWHKSKTRLAPPPRSKAKGSTTYEKTMTFLDKLEDK